MLETNPNPHVKLYIANCTRQNMEFHYRLDMDERGERETQFRPANKQTIPPGRQVVVGGKAFLLTQIESIIRQLTPFGMIAVKEVPNANKRAPYVFNVEQPVPAAIIRDVMDINAGVLTVDGRHRRQNAAIAVNNLVSAAVNEQFAAHGIPKEATQTVDVEFEQEEQSEAGERTIGEGYFLRDDAPDHRNKRGPGRPRKQH